jgi:hypothetical protein
MTRLEGDNEFDNPEEAFQVWIGEPPQKSDDTDKPADSTTFFTTCGSINPGQGYKMIQALNNQATRHALTQLTDDITDATTYISTRYSDDNFAGTLTDTSAATVSSSIDRW